MSLRRINISIIVPVYKESKIINAELRSLKVHDAEHLKEVIVVDCLGDTISAVEHDLITWDKLKLVKSEVKGRAMQMNLGASKATGDILLFLHADTELPRNGLFSVIDLMRNQKISAGAFDLSFDIDSLLYRITAFNSSMRSRLLHSPYGDQAIFVRRLIFEEILGFHNMPLFEDVDLCRRLKNNGFKIGFTGTAIVTSSRRYQKSYTMAILRHWWITVLYYFGIDVEKLAKLYN